MFESFDHGVLRCSPGRRRTTLRSRRLFVALRDEAVTSYHAATRTTLARFAQQTLALAAQEAASGCRRMLNLNAAGGGIAMGGTGTIYDPEKINFCEVYTTERYSTELLLGVLVQKPHELWLARVHFEAFDLDLRGACYLSVPAERISAPTRISAPAQLQRASLGLRLRIRQIVISMYSKAIKVCIASR